MNDQEYQTIHELEHRYWWHIGRRYIVKTILKKYLSTNGNQLILDIGCGTGGNFNTLRDFGKVVGVDNSKQALEFAQQKGHTETVVASAIDLPFTDQKFNCVVMLDVLEHIEDDYSALEEAYRVLKPNGGFLLTVPAYQWLWSGHDEALGHIRRYVKNKIIKKVIDAGFYIEFQSYAISILFPIIALYRLVTRTSKMEQTSSYVVVPEFMNSFFMWLLCIEGLMFRLGINLPFGTSIVIYASKRD
ncbi:hypothetical protein A3H10_01775 [Candidatus Uhrbacteria bacterium RIFCSPLOWO2_12_FULL_46_10]|uniref:Methyltransferase type 11 domain-containing protein n=1 Tax=Candidatus Uhrbacteria bacterium RIFCSPLOWO2_01_FULL_47_25 TaxID=1802402 RepID=A0A1F7UUP4_9BACT|nr:MAG: Methyltransferase type 11 [Parcubacteria group bacterium GW2011_GWA2_46_9]OGL60749.1 MAG: hypothetical protein A2752_03355 [Candidatus Uhrbacteria bacterium RIFCSPHIGHO2_01_FULL_46_23]OGL69538.1 MAG: hypothetical protein A3D60_00860 [Candidatus Uhrbacteria bacterium RIFCSPHIGHO2_02_FULL_47_29]OGL76000.1 MAG: hypothetical protein A3E96_02080 [Candidatus Uhrbacteria bacterium RIFCSPHIGHO2_12_FULL_46_13]OGL81397.1 MAG: hypothetical protein A2936_00180 [Candidatus Uhrbacteria bacterium RIFC